MNFLLLEASGLFFMEKQTINVPISSMPTCGIEIWYSGQDEKLIINLCDLVGHDHHFKHLLTTPSYTCAVRARPHHGNVKILEI